MLTNSSSKASQVGNAVGLDAPASLLTLLRAMRRDGYSIDGVPATSDGLMTELLARGSYDEEHPLDPAAAERFAARDTGIVFRALPAASRKRMEEWWGVPTDRGDTLRSPDRRVDKKIASKAASTARRPSRKSRGATTATTCLRRWPSGNAIVALQPPRGYGMNPDAIYHTPDLPPTHHYAAFYRWLATPVAEGGWGADAIVHVGKHGTLEWLPGKGVGLSDECFPDALLGDLPLVYPFIVNDPGEGSQAKRRGHAVIVDHLMPPMTSADTYGPLAALNDLVNEYYAAEKLDATTPAHHPAADLGADSAGAAPGGPRPPRDAGARPRRSQARMGRRADAGRRAGDACRDERQRRRPPDRRHRRLPVRARHRADP